MNVKTISTLGRTDPSRIDVRTDSAWRYASGAVPQSVPCTRTDEVGQRVMRYASGVPRPGAGMLCW